MDATNTTWDLRVEHVDTAADAIQSLIQNCIDDLHDARESSGYWEVWGDLAPQLEHASVTRVANVVKLSLPDGSQITFNAYIGRLST